MFPKMIFTQVEINIIKLGSLLFRQNKKEVRNEKN